MCLMSFVQLSRAAAAALALCAGLAGCGSGSDRPLISGVAVHGQLRRTGGPQGAPQPGVAGQITFTDTAGGQTTEVPTRNDGTFTATLTPGTYTVTGRAPAFGDSQGLCRTDGKVVVQDGVGPITVACSRR